MPHAPVASTFTEDELYTVAVCLLYRLHDLLTDADILADATRVDAAVGDLDRGPWRFLGGSGSDFDLSFGQTRYALDAALDRLSESAQGLAAQEAIISARWCLRGPFPASS